MTKIKSETNTTQDDSLTKGVLYFGWPNKPSSRTMKGVYVAFAKYQKYVKLTDILTPSEEGLASRNLKNSSYFVSVSAFAYSSFSILDNY